MGRALRRYRLAFRYLVKALTRDLGNLLPKRAAGSEISTETPSREPPTDPVRTGRSRRKPLLLATGSVLAVATLAGISVLAWAVKDVPWAEVSKGTRPTVVVLEDSRGNAIIPHGAYSAEPAKREDFPQHLIDAVLSIEDRRFYDHAGFDPVGIARALVENVFAGRIRQGGSTITQQLIKIRYLDDDRTYKRKIQEAVVALWLESRLDKDEILTRYLNSIYMGAGATGMPAAAQVYFGKNIGDVSLAEAAMLAGMIRAPSRLNPRADRDKAEERAGVVLRAMEETGAIREDQTVAALGELAGIEPVNREASRGGWFSDWVDEEARKIAGTLGGSVSVRTTMDPEMQALAEEVVSQALQDSAGDGGPTQAALVAMRPDGAVVAMVGGAEYEAGGFNRAVAAQRQPGSTFKLFVYHAALQAGYDPRDVVNDSPIEIDDWAPENFGGDFKGRVTIAEAFARSLNAATVRLAQEVGIENVIRSARELGVDGELKGTPSLALGTSEVTLLDLTGAYASVRAGRVPIQPSGIAELRVDGSQQPLRIGRGGGAVMDPRVRQPLLGLLRLAVEKGTGRAADIDAGTAGKTGTSQNYRDAWFIGFNEQLVVGVWVGNDDGSPMKRVTGGSIPAEIFAAFLSRAGTLASPANEVDRELVTSAIGQGEPGEVAACDIRACERRYRSSRASDCTYQPRSGPREFCTAGNPQPRATAGGAGEQTEGTLFSTLFPQRAPGQRLCNIAACDREYRSFRASDCTYRSYSGRRKVCEIGVAPSQEAAFGAFTPRAQRTAPAASCNVRSCQREYRSFRASDCTYQPYRGPRRLCTR